MTEVAPSAVVIPSEANSPLESRLLMKLVVRSPTQLIIRDSAMPVRAVAVFLLALGGIAMATGLSSDPNRGISVVPVFFGVMFGAGGLAMLVLPWSKTFAFSKSDHVFVLAKERFGRVERETIPLRDIADVSLDESPSAKGDSTYRVTMTLAHGRSVPWTSYYTSGRASKQAVVDLVREFLELDPPPTLAAGTPVGSGQRRPLSGKSGMIIMGLVCAAFLGVGIMMFAKEQRALTAYLPVTATVLSTRVDVHGTETSRTRTYTPVVVYRYHVQGREYTANRVTPLQEGRSSDWASKLVAHYRIGSDYTAFYDPEHPGDAFLLRTRSVMTWAVFIVPPLLGIFVMAAVIVGRRAATRLPTAPDR